MKYPIAIAAIAIFGATSASACEWANRSFYGHKGGFRTSFSVDKNCSSMVFQSSGNAGFQKTDTPEKFALTATSEGWAANINGVTATLLKGAKWVNFIGSGVNNRVSVRQNHTRGGDK